MSVYHSAACGIPPSAKKASEHVRVAKSDSLNVVTLSHENILIRLYCLNVLTEVSGSGLLLTLIIHCNLFQARCRLFHFGVFSASDWILCLVVLASSVPELDESK